MHCGQKHCVNIAIYLANEKLSLEHENYKFVIFQFKRPELCNHIKTITKFKLDLCIAVENITQKFQNVCPIATKEKALK